LFRAWYHKAEVLFSEILFLPENEWCDLCSAGWFAMQLVRTLPIQRANIAAAQLAYLQSTSSEIANCRSDVGAAVSCFRRGTNAKNAFTKVTPALVDKFGARIETADGFQLRWIEHFASIEAGDIVPADYIVDAVIAAEAQKSSIVIDGTLAHLPRCTGMFQAIRKSKPHAAPGPDLIGPGIWRHQKAIGWAANQLQALALKQSLTLKAPIQNRGGSLFALWKKGKHGA
jgi:hypothetical protein